MTNMWLPFNYHVTTMWLPCDYNVTTMWLPCDYHVTRLMLLHEHETLCWHWICRQDEIDPAIEQHLQENQGFIDNFARGTAHMFRLEAVKVHTACNHVIGASLSEPHTSMTSLHPCVCIYVCLLVYAWPTTYHKSLPALILCGYVIR